MKRQCIAIGLAALGLVLFAFIVSTIAAPGHAPLAQVPQEQEPNDSFDDANSMVAGGSIQGALTRTLDTLDYFYFTTTPGRAYTAKLFVTDDNPSAIPLLITVYNGNREFVKDSGFGSTGGGTVQWDAVESLHYVLLQAIPSSQPTGTVPVVNYVLAVNLVQGSPTPSNTPPPGVDVYEPNNFITETYDLPIAVSSTAPNANFSPPGDEDWFSFYVKQGRYYQAETSNLTGVDTRIEIFDEDGTKVADDNDGGGGFASRAQWRASQTGWFDIRVTNLVSSGASDTYDLTVAEIAAPPTATPTPAPASPGQIDRCEDNSTLDQACTIAVNSPETFNFVSPHSGPDNDHYRVWVKPGLLFSCRTSNLSPGVDPNLILYDQNRNGIGGNDDVAPGDYNCALSHYATYSGWLYLLVGYGNRSPSDIANSNYTLSCTSSQAGVPTPTARAPAQPTATAKPVVTTPTSAPVATPEPQPQLSVRVLATPAPGVRVTPAPRFVPIDLLVYYDANDDWQPGAGEGIAGVSAQAYAAATNQLLAQGFTDDRGHLEFTVAAQGPVRVSIPFLGFSQLVATTGGSIYVRVAPALAVGGAH
jgi:hypothetical protein